MDQRSKSSSAPPSRIPSRTEAEDAIRTLLRWAGDDPQREGLLDTPKRVVSAFEEYFSGYKEDPIEILKRTFDEVYFGTLTMFYEPLVQTEYLGQSTKDAAFVARYRDFMTMLLARCLA